MRLCRRDDRGKIGFAALELIHGVNDLCGMKGWLLPQQSRGTARILQDLRIERAAHFSLKTSNARVDQIAADVGYTEGVTRRALLRNRLGRGVREIRHRL
jgi:hypothetical protein